MGLQINGEYVDDVIIRQEAASMRPRYEEMMQEMDPIAREMQLRDWARENVIERVLLRQAAMATGDPVPPEEIDERLTAMFPPAGDLEDCEAGTTRAGVDKDAARQLADHRHVRSSGFQGEATQQQQEEQKDQPAHRFAVDHLPRAGQQDRGGKHQSRIGGGFGAGHRAVWGTRASAARSPSNAISRSSSGRRVSGDRAVIPISASRKIR